MSIIEWVDQNGVQCFFPVRSDDGQKCILNLALTLVRFRDAQSMKLGEWTWIRDREPPECHLCGEQSTTQVQCSECGAPVPMHAGSKFDKYGESGYVWAVFDRSASEEFLQAQELSLTHEHAPSALTGWSNFYRGAGRAFGADPSIRIGRTRVLVRQHRGLDI